MEVGKINMANNRLYIGDNKDKCYLFVSKGFADGWHGLPTDTSKIDKFLLTRRYESEGGGKPT